MAKRDPHGLTEQAKRFCVYYLEQNRENATLAAKKAGYKSPRAAMQRLLKDQKVIRYLGRLESLVQEELRKRDSKRSQPAPEDPVDMIADSRPTMDGPREDGAVTVGEVESAIATRAECLEIISNAARCRLADFLMQAPGGALVANPEKILAAPKGVLKKFSHDAAGDAQFELESPQSAARALLEHYDSALGADDPMQRPRLVMQQIIFEGTDADRLEFDRLALKAAELQGQVAVPGQPMGHLSRVKGHGGGNGDGPNGDSPA